MSCDVVEMTERLEMSGAPDIEREKADKFCSEALIAA